MNNELYPEIGRFLNADAFVSTGQGQLGNNMFAYCGNNPVNLIDPLGYWHWPTWDEVEEWLKEAVDVLVQVALGIIGGVCGLWGIGRAVSAIWEEMYD